MRKLFASIAIVIVALLLLSGCAFLQNLTEQYQPQTYTFNYNGRDYSVILPQHIPLPSENAQQNPANYWGGVSAMHVWYMEGPPAHPVMPVLSLWFTKDLGVFGLIWHTLKPEGEIKHEGFLVVKSLLVPTDEDRFQEILDSIISKGLKLGDSV